MIKSRLIKRGFALFLITIFSFMLNCDGGEKLESDLIEVTTADGIVLKMRRYRPAAQNGLFRTGQQPIILFTGILENMNQFLCQTPEDKGDGYEDMELPANIASWAVGDSYIAADPMKYYSIAHFLWLKGYDVWLPNYRSIGRGDYRSGKGGKYTTLDIWATLDTPAVIDKVKTLTGMNPIIGGHSTGGLVSYLYLQGLTIDAQEVIAAGDEYAVHVQYDPVLASIRNQEIKGFIGLDPAGKPPLPFTGIIDLLPIWAVLQMPLFIDLDTIIRTFLANRTFGSIPYLTTEVLMGTIATMDEVFDIQQKYDLFGALRMWEMKNTNKYVEDFIVRYGFSSFYLRALGQYADWGVHDVLREHYKNGEENWERILPPHPGSSYDNLVNYDQMNLMTVPAISIFSEAPSLVETTTMVRELMDAKTPHPNDEWYELPGSAHMDVPIGNNAPTHTYVWVGAWLDKIK